MGEIVLLRLVAVWGVVGACGAGLGRGIQGLEGRGRREEGAMICCMGNNGINGISTGGSGGGDEGGGGRGAITLQGGKCAATSL